MAARRPADVDGGELHAARQQEEGHADAAGEQEPAAAALVAMHEEEDATGKEAAALPQERVDPAALNNPKRDGPEIDEEKDEAGYVAVVAVSTEGAVRLDELQGHEAKEGR